jgi:hypothetical protein
LALPVDSLAHREATDSNLVWEAQEGPSGLPQVAVRPPVQASPTRATQKSDGVRPQARPQAASRQQGLSLALEKQLDARQALQQLAAREKS